MGRTVSSKLDGGMRGPRGQYRGSTDNEVLHMENLLVERGGQLRNRPATHSLPFDLVRGDRLIPFEWQAKRYFFLYNTYHRFSWKVRDYRYVLPDRVVRGNRRVSNPPQFRRWLLQESSEYDLTGTVSDALRMLLAGWWLNLSTRTLGGFRSGINSYYNPWTWDDERLMASLQDPKGGGLFFNPQYPLDGGSVGDRVQDYEIPQRGGEDDVGSPEVNLNIRASVFMGLFNRYKTFGAFYNSYQAYFFQSILQMNRFPFYVWDTIKAFSGASTAKEDPRNFIYPLWLKLTPSTFNHRFMVLKEDGTIVGNGVTRGMPGTLNQNFENDEEFEWGPRIAFDGLSLGEGVVFKGTTTAARPENVLTHDMGESEASYVVEPGVNNVVATDPTGVLPPLAIMGTGDGEYFKINELSTLFTDTGLRKNFIPSNLTPDEFKRLALWRGKGNVIGKVFDGIEGLSIFSSNPQFQSLRHVVAKSEEVEKALQDSLTEANAELGPQRRSQQPFEPTGELPLRFEGAVIENTITKPYVEAHSGGSVRDVQNKDGNPEGVVKLRYAINQSSRLSVLLRARVSATPFFEQCPVVSFFDFKVPGTPGTDSFPLQRFIDREGERRYNLDDGTDPVADQYDVFYGVDPNQRDIVYPEIHKQTTLQTVSKSDVLWIGWTFLNLWYEVSGQRSTTKSKKVIGGYYNVSLACVDREANVDDLIVFILSGAQSQGSCKKWQEVYKWVKTEQAITTGFDGRFVIPRTIFQPTGVSDEWMMFLSNIVPVGRNRTSDSDGNDTGPRTLIDPLTFYREHYETFAGEPVTGLSPGHYFTNCVAGSNRYKFTGAKGYEDIDCTTSTSDIEPGRTVTSTKIDTWGPEQGLFDFSASWRIRPPTDFNVDPLGYTQAFSEDGGVQVLWVVEEPDGSLLIGTNRGTFTASGLDLKGYLASHKDFSEIPSRIRPKRVNGLQYQVSSGERECYIVERSNEYTRKTYRSAVAGISDFFDEPIKQIEGLQDTGRLCVLTEAGRLFIGTLNHRGDPLWSEMTFGRDTLVDGIGRQGLNLYVTTFPRGGSRTQGRVLRLNLQDNTPIEPGAQLSLTLKHPSSYLIDGSDKALNSLSQAKYLKGHLLGSFLSEGSPDEVFIETYQRPGTRSEARSLTEVKFSSIDLKNINDGIKFRFDARRVEVDSVHMEIRS